MTDYKNHLVHPGTKQKMPCICIEHYFGRNEYGFRFDGDNTMYRWQDIEQDQPRHRVSVTPYKD